MPTHNHGVAVIGAGPAGLTAAYLLTKRGVPVTVLEATDTVGGISQTVERDGWRFDIGGHRFFTKVREVEELWHELLRDDEFLLRPRLSRIASNGKFFDYPLKPVNALRNLGFIEAVRCVLSYLWVRVRRPDDSSYEGWVASRFGWRLYRKFFKTYTEKVWGIDASDMPADWAAQRIKNLSLGGAVINALTPKRNQKDITSLIEEFQYPKYGPGMMWERARDLVVDSPLGAVVMRSPVVTIHRDQRGATGVTTRDWGGTTSYADADHVISSMPLPELVRALDPPAPDYVRTAAAQLTHRDFLTVALVVPADAGFPDNWIYIHTPGVKVGRIQNFGSWSPFMVKDGRTCLGLEYFVNEGDELWQMADEDLVRMATQELEQLGLVPASAVERGYAVRIPKAYPVYDADYRDNVETIRAWLDKAVPNVHPVGRNGMHKYNNQDHSMYTAMLTVENILGAEHDTWAVNVEEEYHEEASGTSGTGRAAPITRRPQNVGAA